MTEGLAASLSEYVADVQGRQLPEVVLEAASLHVLDTIAAAISGRALAAGVRGRDLVDGSATVGDATVWGHDRQTSQPLAALANAMAAHADETDDSHGASRTHPGCSIVPASLAAAEMTGLSGEALLRAVVLGYDVCARLPPALWPTLIESGRDRVRSTHAAGGLFGAATAVASLHRFSARQVRHVLAYATQQLAGIRSYFHDPSHVEKAFVFAGMPAFNATMATEFVRVGWPGGEDPFCGTPNLFDLGLDPDPTMLTRDLGSDFAVLATKFKKYPVASPVQSALDALLTVMRIHALRSDQIAGVLVTVQSMRLATVKDRPIADVNIDFLLTVALEHASVPFAVIHDPNRFASWCAPGGADSRIRVEADDTLPTSHAARVVVTTRQGETLTCEVPAIPGSSANPMTRADVESKARELMTPHLEDESVDRIISDVRCLAELDDVRPLIRRLAAASSRPGRGAATAEALPRPHEQGLE